jgi:hypothetical protein
MKESVKWTVTAKKNKMNVTSVNKNSKAASRKMNSMTPIR